MAVCMGEGRPKSGSRQTPPAAGSAKPLDHLSDTLVGVIGSSSNPIFSVDTDYRYTGFNASHAAAMKELYRADIALGESILSYQAEADRVIARANLDRALRGESFAESAYSGEPVSPRRFFEVTHDPIRDMSGAVVGVAVQARDLTELQESETALSESVGRYRRLFETMREGYAYCRMLFDAKGRPRDWIYLAVNPAFERLTGLGDVVGKRVTEILPGTREENPELFEIYGRVVGSGRPEEFEIDFKPLNMRLRVSAFRPEPEHFVAVFEDVTERRRTEDALAETVANLREVLDASPAAIVVVDAALNVVDWNPAAHRIFGWTATEVLGKQLPTIDLESEDARTGMEAMFAGHMPEPGDVVRRRKDGSLVELNQWNVPLRDADGQIKRMLGMFIDLSDIKQAMDLVEKLAFYDALTNLPNHTLFHDRLRQAIAIAQRSQRPLAVAALNVDRFQRITDSFGHQMADRFLQQLAEALAHAVHDRDTLSRSGPNDFLVLLPELRDSRDAARVGQRLLTAARGPWQAGEHAFRASVSIGMALFPGDGAEADELVQRAEWALRRAKEAGPGICQFFDESMSAHAKERLGLETQLHRALEEGQFVVYYQPQVDLRSSEIVGAEALVRWAHPERGLVPPLEFIPIAEETGLIVALDHLVLEAACAHIGASMAASNRSLRLAVNLSARELGSPDVAKGVAQVLRDRGFPPELLEIEITETAAMAHRDIAGTAVAALKSLGVTVALDDFGTGYSSLSHLHGLAVQRLKIDRAFIKDLPGNDDSAAIASAVISLAHSFGIGVVAEGIETREQLEFLLEQGCDEGQGYLFGRPMPAEEWETFLADWSWPPRNGHG
jgi:diguanylate cyclase (GGDEF)-like protein/PAS domain S-box-containing protein